MRWPTSPSRASSSRTSPRCSPTAHGLAAVTDALAEVASGADLVAGIDARGFLLGAAVATKLGTGVLAIRKGGKLPPPVRREELRPRVRHRALEIPADGIDLAGRSIVIIDDVLATGGTMAAARKLLIDGGASRADRGGGAGTDRPGWPRGACSAAGDQLAHHLSGQSGLILGI